MHLVEQRELRPIESEHELHSYFTDACKPPSQWRVGTERELIGVYTDREAVGTAPTYEGPRGIRAILEGLQQRGWAPVFEGEHIIALVRGDAQVTIEPGGQLELAARPVTTAADLQIDLGGFCDEVGLSSQGFDVTWLGVGFRPFGHLEEVPWMPKGRYDIMREYLPTRGRLAHEMMKRTATVQVNLDYSDAEDAAEKLRAAMSVTSLLTAMYANSPIVDGVDSGYQSYRAWVWHHTDPDRSGLLPLVFEDGDVFASYTQWALDVPMFFVHRGSYQPAGGMTFRRFLRDGFQGHRATMDDWALHLSTLFPEVRMKRFLEVRGCDSGAWDTVLALGPLCQGLLYDRDSRRAAIALTKSLTSDQRSELWSAVSREALAARVPGTTHTVADLAKEFIDIATAGLKRLAPDEIPYLEPLRALVDSGRTQADDLRSLWQQAGSDPLQVIAALKGCNS